MLSCTPLTPSLSKNCVNDFVTNPKFLASENRTAGGSGLSKIAGARKTAPTTRLNLRSKSGG